MKKILLFLLILLLIPISSITAYGYESSDWARESIEKARDLGVDYMSYDGNYREPIDRASFAQNAVSLVGLVFDVDMSIYSRVIRYRSQLEGMPYNGRPLLLVANELGILKGRGNTDLDPDSLITRQEAAVMLARTYRVYMDEIPNAQTTIFFADQDAIADWAMDDIQLMYHLGIMDGIGNRLFDPLGSYTFEQCFVTLLRLYEVAIANGPNQPNPFPMSAREQAIGSIALGYLLTELETEKYYILIWGTGGTMSGDKYYISIIDEDLSSREYKTAVLSGSGFRGNSYADPKDARISEDGTQLIYTATVERDVHSYNSDQQESTTDLLFAKGLYTVTMDLKTGDQSYLRADLP